MLEGFFKEFVKIVCFVMLVLRMIYIFFVDRKTPKRDLKMRSTLACCAVKYRPLPKMESLDHVCDEWSTE